MIMKNLTAHKLRNKMTSIIYSIALGFVIFLVVVYNLQLKVIQLQELQSIGAYFSIESVDFTKITPELFDPILTAHSANIESFAFIATRMNDDAFYAIRDAQCSDNSRIVSDNMYIEAA
jgi:hypothetical protein